MGGVLSRFTKNIPFLRTRMMREEFKKPLNKLKVKKGPQKKEIFQNGNSENMFTRKVTITLSTGKVLLSAEVTL